MKKFLLSLSAVALTGASLLAQDYIRPKEEFIPAEFNQPMKRYAKTPLNNSSRFDVVSQRVNALDMVVSYFGYAQPPILVTPLLYQDSTVRLEYVGGIFAGPGFHSFGQTFDFDGLVINSELTNNAAAIDPTEDYVLDSVIVDVFYNRVDNSVVDTARIQIVSGNGNFNAGGFFSNPDSTKLVVATTGPGSLDLASTIYETKIPLDDAFFADSVIQYGRQFLKVPTNLTVSGTHAGALHVDVQYISGKTLTANDTAFRNANAFRMICSSPAGSGANYPNGFGPDLTVAQFLNFQSRYPSNGNPPLDYTLNPLAYGATDLTYQALNMDIYVTQSNTIGVDELENGAKLFQNYPNPTTGLTTVKYELANTANVNFEVMDLTGKTVFTSNEGSRTAGTHFVEFNTDNLNAGVYFYSVSINGNKLTNKMTVTK